MAKWLPFSLYLLALVYFSGVLSQEAAAPEAALAPEAAAALLPNYVSPTPQEALAFVPMSEAAKAQLVQAVLAGVEETKAEVKQALADPSAAFKQYSANWAAGTAAMAAVPAPGSAADTKTLTQRKRIFLSNLRRYERLNARSTTMAHGITPFSHLTQEEFRTMMLPYNFAAQYEASAGVIAEAGQPGRKLQACNDAVPNPYSTGTPPASVDWVKASMLPPIRDQKQCGSCAAFATTALAEFAYIKKTKAAPTTVDFSEQELLDCTAGNQCAGAATNQYFGKIVCYGMANETRVPYTAVDKDSCTVPPPRQLVGMTGWSWVPYNNANALALAVAKAPTLIAVDATNWSSYASGYMPCTPGSTVNHAVVAVGYMNGAVINSVKQDYWIIRNSWGTYWGRYNTYKGYAFVRKDCPNPGAFNMYQYNPVVGITA